MTAETESIEAGFAEVLAASVILDDLPDVARVEAWVSSVLAVWSETPDASAIDEEFVLWLTASSNDRAPLLLLALSRLLDVDPMAVDTATGDMHDLPLWCGKPGAGVAISAWEVVQRETASVGIAFEMTDGSEHSLLGDIVDGVLVSLVVGPAPGALFFDPDLDNAISPDPLDVPDAARRIIEAWEGLVAADLEIPESVHVNAAIGRRRLADLTGQDLSHLFRPNHVPPEFRDEVDPAERLEFNAWAISVLDGAGAGPGKDGDPCLLDTLDPIGIATYPAAEREAFVALEWADWLGVVLGLRAVGDNVTIEPTMLVDLINASQQVTSTIPSADRAYIEWAFSLVLPLWRQADVLDSANRLNGDGVDHLVGALRTAWAVE